MTRLMKYIVEQNALLVLRSLPLTHQQQLCVPNPKNKKNVKLQKLN